METFSMLTPGFGSPAISRFFLSESWCELAETKEVTRDITFDGEHLNWVAASQNRNRLSIWEEELQRCIPPGEPFQKAKALALLNELYEQRDLDPQPPPKHSEQMYLLNRTWGWW